MGNEQQTRLPALLQAQAPVVEGRHHRLARAGGGHHQVAPAAVVALQLQLVEHLLLVSLWGELEKRRAGQDVVARLTPQRLAERAAVGRVGRVVALKLAVFPQGFEVGAGPLEELGLAALGELGRPLQPAHQRSARQVGAAHVGAAEAGAAPEQPGLGVQPGAPAIQGDADLAARQPGERVERPGFGGAGVGGREDADAGSRLSVGTDGRDGLQDVEQLAHAGVGDEADQDVHPVAGRQLTAQLGEQRGRALAGGEQPGRRQPRLGWHRWGGLAVDGLQDAGGRGNDVGALRSAPQPLAEADEDEIDQLQLLAQLVAPLAFQVVQDLRQLGHQHLGEARRGVVGVEGLEAAGVLVGAAGDELVEAAGEELVVKAVGQCHAVSPGALRLAGVG